MYIVKLLGLLLLGLYLVVVGLEGLGVHLAFVHPGILGFIALVAGVLFIIKAIKGYICECKECKECNRPPYDKP